MNHPGPPTHTKDSVVVIRLWLESHDRRARAILFTATAHSDELAEASGPMIGLKEILPAVAARIRALEEQPD